uniref:Uncharacterized protein n=1 Tax=Arundo donax TaxID=35708 RepID=A0A0A8YU80_ARUDO
MFAYNFEPIWIKEWAFPCEFL